MNSIILPAAVLLGLKIFFLVGMVVYAIFALVIVQQERLMSNVIEPALEPWLKIIVISHLIAAISLILLSLLLL